MFSKKVYMKYVLFLALALTGVLAADQQDDIRADQRRQDRLRAERNADLARQRYQEDIRNRDEDQREIRNEEIKKQQQRLNPQ